MANTTVERIKVDELSKFGFKVGQEYLNYSKQLKESDKVYVVPGAELEVELYVADSGKRYLNKVLTSLAKAVTMSKIKPEVKTEAKDVDKVFADAPMTRQDWNNKDRRISRQGVIQAAVQAVSHLSADTTDMFANAVTLANDMLKFVNEVK
jgi:hypothetical protein